MANTVQRNFHYYARIVMMIILFIEFILNIVFISVISESKNIGKR